MTSCAKTTGKGVKMEPAQVRCTAACRAVRLTDLQCGNVIGHFVTNGRLNVHNVVRSEQLPQLLLVLVDHLDHSEDEKILQTHSRSSSRLQKLR